MFLLENPRHEAFAQARAKGALLDDAYEDAGFAPGNGHASRLAKRPEVAERIAELRAEQSDIGAAGPRGVIATLLRLAEAGLTQGTAGGIKEARETLLEARRLYDNLADRRQRERELLEMEC